MPACPIEGTAAVVNAVSLYVEPRAETLDAVHVRGAAALVCAARQGTCHRLDILTELVFNQYMNSSTKSRRRSYRLGRRAETAEETRRRIVEATYALHSEQGIAATSMKQIAERAGVSVGTVYHHFPTYPEAITACGEYAAEQVPPPGDSIFDGADSRRDRIDRLASALFDYYERMPALGSVRRDTHVADVLQGFVDEEAENRRRLAARAVGGRAADRRAALVAALVDLDVYQAMRRQGFDTAAAAERIAALLNCWLDSQGRSDQFT